ncbi:MAG: sigma 54-interacting transcriptional regulator [Gammaproteobacteria bacterium]
MSDDRLNSADFRQMPVLAALLDAEGCFLDVTEDWVRRLGFSRDEVLGQSPADLATVESRERISQEYLPGFRRSGRLDHAPVEFLGRSGEVVELLLSAAAVDDDEGQFKYTVSVFVDSSERARAERRYRSLYHATPAMLHTIDSEGRITDVSDWWLYRLGYERDYVVGRSILDFMSAESRASMTKVGLQELISHGDSKNVPRQMVTSKNEVLDVLMSAHTERNEQDGLVRLLVASKDMTERNRGEAKLREAYGEIARLKEELERERDYLREEVDVSMNFGRIVGESPVLAGMLARIEAVAETPANVLIVGETGTGKELVAHAIHARSKRADAPLVKVNCASIPHELFESEFFGHVKGAFTGAYRDRVGRFQLADGGTIFLDEVGEIPIELQGKLLRVLQEKEFERVGEETTRSVDVRVIAATNRDLEQEVEKGNFREDLYYRLSVFPLQVPPLRRRGGDVVQLAAHFLEQTCREFGRPVPLLSMRQLDLMQRYKWPGNVRELKNIIERAVILSPSGSLKLDLVVEEEDLPAAKNFSESAARPATSRFLSEQEMRAQHKANTMAALEHANWKISGKRGAAELLGMKPSTLADRMRAFGIKKPDRGT